MIVTTWGAAGALSPALQVRTGGAGFLGDGAGVCALTAPQQSARLTKTAARILILTAILLKTFLMPVYQTRFGAN